MQQQPTATSLPRGRRSALSRFPWRHVGAQTWHQRRSSEQLPEQKTTFNLHSWNVSVNTCSLKSGSQKNVLVKPMLATLSRVPYQLPIFFIITDAQTSVIHFKTAKQLCIAEGTLQKQLNGKNSFHFIYHHVGKTSNKHRNAGMAQLVGTAVFHGQHLSGVHTQLRTVFQTQVFLTSSVSHKLKYM